MLREGEPVPGRILRDGVARGVLAKVPQQRPLDRRGVGAESGEARREFVIGPGPAAKREVRTVQTELFVPRVGEELFLELAPIHGRSVPQTAGSYTRTMAQAPVLPRGFELPLEPRLPRIGSVDAVALEERAASLAEALDQARGEGLRARPRVRMMDLTTLEGRTRPARSRARVEGDPTRPE
jgi:hypothetical protein